MKRSETGYKKNISKEEVDLLLNNINNYKAKVICRILQYTGMRIGDCVKLQVKNIKGYFKSIDLIESKTKKAHSKPINSKLRNIMIDYFDKERINFFEYDKYIFSSRNHKSPHIKTNSIRWYFHKALIKSGLKDCYYVNKNGQKLQRISPHVLRHYFATQVYTNSGFDARATANMLNHAKIETTFKHYIDDIDYNRKMQLAEMVE